MRGSANGTALAVHPSMRTALLVSILYITACQTSEGDESLYLTGTEESYVTTSTGQKACLGKKVLVCHVPPGNPANAHTICVGKSAVDAHSSNHGDAVGACATEPSTPPEEPPPVEVEGDPIL